jgi:hypothetical protein
MEACSYGEVHVGPLDGITTAAPHFTIVDEQRREIRGTAPVQRAEDKCNLRTVEELTTALDLTLQRLDGARSMDDLNRGKTTMDLLMAAEGMEGCVSAVMRMVEFGPQKAYVSGRECSEEWNSSAWRNDPCCNWELTSTQCCRVRDLEIEETGIQSIVDSALSQCRPENKSVVEQALRSYQSFFNAQNSGTGGCNASRSSLTWE